MLEMRRNREDDSMQLDSTATNKSRLPSSMTIDDRSPSMTRKNTLVTPSASASCPNVTSKTRKFDPLLDNVIDIYKVDLNLIRRQIRDYLREKDVARYELISDLILDYLESERFPDAKVIQCDLVDIGLVTPSIAKKLIRRLWDDLLENENYHKGKYQRTLAPNGSSKRVSSSSSSYSCQNPVDSGYHSNYRRYIDHS